MAPRVKEGCQFEGVILLTALYGAEARGMRNAERRKVNVLEMKCLRSFMEVSRVLYKLYKFIFKRPDTRCTVI